MKTNRQFLLLVALFVAALPVTLHAHFPYTTNCKTGRERVLNWRAWAIA